MKNPSDDLKDGQRYWHGWPTHTDSFQHERKEEERVSQCQRELNGRNRKEKSNGLSIGIVNFLTSASDAIYEQERLKFLLVSTSFIHNIFRTLIFLSKARKKEGDGGLMDTLASRRIIRNRNHGNDGKDLIYERTERERERERES